MICPPDKLQNKVATESWKTWHLWHGTLRLFNVAATSAVQCQQSLGIVGRETVPEGSQKQIRSRQQHKIWRDSSSLRLSEYVDTRFLDPLLHDLAQEVRLACKRRDSFDEGKAKFSCHKGENSSTEIFVCIVKSLYAMFVEKFFALMWNANLIRSGNYEEKFDVDLLTSSNFRQLCESLSDLI